MPDTQTAMEIRQQIALYEADMKRATDRGSDAARNIVRSVYADLLRVDFKILQAAVDDLLEAQRNFNNALKRRNELKSQLGE